MINSNFYFNLTLTRAEQLVKVVRNKILQRGAKGIIGLQRIFKIMDDDNSKCLCREEFAKACRDFKIGINEDDIGVVYNAFDVNKDGAV